jgi:hypothetical protein
METSDSNYLRVFGEARNQKSRSSIVLIKSKLSCGDAKTDLEARACVSRPEPEIYWKT